MLGPAKDKLKAITDEKEEGDESEKDGSDDLPLEGISLANQILEEIHELKKIITVKIQFNLGRVHTKNQQLKENCKKIKKSNGLESDDETKAKQKFELTKVCADIRSNLRVS